MMSVGMITHVLCALRFCFRKKTWKTIFDCYILEVKEINRLNGKTNHVNSVPIALETPYHCQVCNKPFLRKDYLMIHALTHKDGIKSMYFL